MSKALIFLQTDTNNNFLDVGLQLVSKAIKLCDSVSVLTVGEFNIEALEGYSILKNYHANYYGAYIPSVFADIMVKAIELDNPDMVLIGATKRGRSFGAAVAKRLKTGITADCTSLEINKEGFLLQTRPAFGGNLMADILTRETKPQMATVRSGIFPMPKKTSCEKVIQVDFDVEVNSKVEIIGYSHKNDEVNLEKAERIVAIGGAVKTKQQVEIFANFAKSINAELGCSRVLVERGLMPSSRQIGLTGKNVSPKLLITFGISGSVQFRAGIAKAEKVISVVDDVNANIKGCSKYFVCADIFSIIENLM